jgi:cation diffusion facilitator family transporter
VTEQKAEFAVWLDIVGNLALAILKGITGFLAGSKVLLADAAYSASSVASSFAVLIGIRTANLPPDKDHTYGPGKAEAIASIIVSALLLLVGLEFGISAVKSLWNGVEEPPKSYALIVIVISLIAKEVMFQYKHRLGKKMGSQALIANAWENRPDLFSSVAAFAGVLGSILGKHLGLPFFYYLDPAAGLFVSFLILKMGYNLLMESMHNRLDDVFQQEDAEELTQIVQRIKGVITLDDLRAREHGHYVIVDIKISVNPRISVLEGQDIAKTVKQQLMTRFIHISDVFVHVNPYDPGYPYKNNMDLQQDDFPTLLH